MVTPATLQLSVEWDLTVTVEDPIVNVFHFAKVGDAGAWDATDMQAAVNTFTDAWVSSGVAAQLSAGLVGQRVKCREVENSSTPSIDVAAPEGLRGVVDDLAAKPYECGLVRWNSTAGGASGSGRTFLPGILAVQIDRSGILGTGYRSDLSVAFEAFIEDVQANTTLPMALVIYSRTKHQVATVLGASVRPMVAIQRDRRLGR